MTTRRSLTRIARKIWRELRARVGRKRRVAMSCRGAATAVDTSKSTAHRALVELQRKRFIVRRGFGRWRASVWTVRRGRG